MSRDIRKLFANKIIKLRNEKGFSQEELATISGIDRSYMSRIERGIVSTGIVKISQLATAFNMTESDLLNFK